MANLINQKSAYLVGKWNKRLKMIESVQKKPLTFEKKVVLANCFENTADRIKAFEATNPGKRFAT